MLEYEQPRQHAHTHAVSSEQGKWLDQEGHVFMLCNTYLGMVLLKAYQIKK